MSRTTHELIQGSEAWHAYRRTKFNASDAAAMLGKSRYVTRAELLAQHAVGTERGITADTQRLFDAGHAYEAQARPIAENIIGEDLYPVTMSYDFEGLPLSASFDGVTMDETRGWEHKTANADLDAALTLGEIPEEYHYQLEQQLLVGGLERILFMASRGTEESAMHAWYESRPDIRARLIAGWKMFQADIAAYHAPEVIPVAAVARPMEDLPAVSVQVNGALAVVSNLDVFGKRLAEFIEGLDMAPEDDQGFADAEKAVKVLERAQEALQAAEQQALAQVGTVDQLVKTVAALRETARATRLRLEKVVKTQKDVVRAKIVQAGKDALAAHIATLDARLGGRHMPGVPADFAGAVKGKRTIASLREAVDAELVRAKLNANEVADRLQINLNILAALDEKHQHLFADRATLIHKMPEDFGAAVKLRIAEYEAKEARRLEAERERIRQEEAAKAKAAEDARAEQERERIRAEERTRAQAEAEADRARADELLRQSRHRQQPVISATEERTQPGPAATPDPEPAKSAPFSPAEIPAALVRTTAPSGPTDRTQRDTTLSAIGQHVPFVVLVLLKRCEAFISDFDGVPGHDEAHKLLADLRAVIDRNLPEQQAA